MTARLIKESRSMLPVLLIGAAVLLACLGLESGNGRLFFATLLYCVFCAVVGIGAVGFEMSHDMHLQMLTQPVPREMFWRDKLLVQGSVLAVLGTLYGWVVQDPSVTEFDLTYWNTFLVMAAVAPLAAFGFGSALVLSLKHVEGSFLLLILLTVGLQFLVWAIWPDSGGMVAAFCVLAFIGCWCGRERFVAFQRYSLLDRMVSFGSKPAVVDAGTIQMSPVVLALALKELRLQSVNLVAFGGALIVGLVIGQFRAEAGWALKDLVCLILPCFVGAISVTGERELKVQHWHLILPVSTRQQWALKLVITVGLAVGLSLVIYGGTRWLWPTGSTNGLLEAAPISFLVCYSLVASVFGILISSVSRSFVQSILFAMLLVAVLALVWGLVAAGRVMGNYGNSNPGKLFLLVCSLVLVAPSLWRAYRNYVSIETTRTLFWRTSAVMAAGLVVSLIVTAAIYHRSWELVGQPALGAALPNGEKVVPVFTSLARGVTLDNQGRLWRMDVKGWLHRTNSPSVPRLTQIGVDSDWVKLVHNRSLWFGHGALKSDGSFWTFVGDRMWETNTTMDGTPFPDKPTEPMPGTRWKDIACVSDHWQGVRDDGTLWTWGANGLSQVGQDHDWMQVVGGTDRTDYGIKEDGSVWEWGTKWTSNLGKEEFIEEPRPNVLMRGFNVTNATGIMGGIIADLEDGRTVVMRELEVYGELPYVQPLLGHARVHLLHRDVRPNWRPDSWFGRPIVPLRNGKLLQEQPWSRGWFGRRLDRTPGSDWLAATRIYDECIGLKTDGSVWHWTKLNEAGHEHPHYYEGQVIQAPKDRLIPYRFRPVKIGMLDLKLWQ